MRIRPRNYSTACAPSGDSAKLCRLAHVQCVTFSHTPSHSNSAPRPWISQPTNRTPHTAHRAPHTAHHTPARGLPEPQRNNRTLPNNVARNSPRSFFDYASKRCNSNTVNSTFEIVARELRATLIEQARRHPTTPGGKQARRQAGPQAPRQDPKVRRHREPRRLVTTVNAATASSIEESGPALHRVPGPSAQRQSSEMGVTP